MSDNKKKSNTKKINLKYFFQHIPKVGGTSILSQLPEEYTSVLYGEVGKDGFLDIGKKMGSKIKKRILKKYPSTISLDHMKISDMIESGLISEDKIDSIDLVTLWRDPIDRFLSTCNHFKLSPLDLILRLENPKIDPFTNIVLGRECFYMTASDIIKHNGKILNFNIFLLGDNEGISTFFNKYDILIKPIKTNTTVINKKTITRKNLNQSDLNFIKDFFSEDFKIYSQLTEKNEKST